MLSTIVAILASQAFGALWYSPVLSGREWLSCAYPGMSEEEIKKRLHVPMNYVTGFLSSLFTTLLLKYYLLQSVSTVGGALSVSLILGSLSAALEVCHYGFEGRSWNLFFIDHIHNFFNILIISCVLVQL